MSGMVWVWRMREYVWRTWWCLTILMIQVIGGTLQERLIPVPYSKTSTDQAVRSSFSPISLSLLLTLFSLYYIYMANKVTARSHCSFSLLRHPIICLLPYFILLGCCCCSFLYIVLAIIGLLTFHCPHLNAHIFHLELTASLGQSEGLLT